MRTAAIFFLAGATLFAGRTVIRTATSDGTSAAGSEVVADLDDPARADESPFVLAGPQNPPLTTLVFPPAPATTSTTVPVTSPPLPDPGSDELCQRSVAIGTIVAKQVLAPSSSAVPTDLAAALRRGADAFERSNDPAFRPLVPLARDAAVQVDSATTVAEVATAMRPFTDPTDPAVAVALATLYDYSSRHCPGITGRM